MRAVLSRVLRRLLQLVGADEQQHARWLRKKQVADTEFDSLFGTVTGGIDEIFDLSVTGENSRYGLSHIATDPSEFRQMIDALALDLSSFTFVDLGCGKGRALILAAQLPFRQIIGVEFAKEFIDVAQSNLERAAQRAEAKSPVTLVWADAAKFEYPDGPVLIYLFNPFGSKVIRQVAANARGLWERQKRPVIVLYMNAVHLQEFLDEGWSVIQRGAGWSRLECRS